MASIQQTAARWHSGISSYQWLVLLLTSLGWIFDVFEGQLFVASMNEAMPALLGASATAGDIAYYNNLALGAFLLGGALGGILFGMLGDRIGRKRTMTYTILLYSACTGLSALAQTWWHLAALRFLAALGVGGEWAVASTMVAEVFEGRARAWAQSLFQASGVLGTYLAVAAGALLVAEQSVLVRLPLDLGTWEVNGWRLAFLLGALPAILILLVRTHLREPEVWLRRAGSQAEPAGRLLELFSAPLRRRTLVGVCLAGIGMATFWGAFIYAKDVLRNAWAGEHAAALPAELKRFEMLGLFLAITGSGVGVLAFGPFANWLGRRRAFLLFLLGSLASVLVLFKMLTSTWAIALFLPVFGFLVVGWHCGFAVYFAELFPTRLRGTGAGFCFNGGRILAVPALFLTGWLQKDCGLTLANSVVLISLLLPLGCLLLFFAPETGGSELPE
jgi:MFS family permease